ncbi:MAG: tyrosyl-tRNA synthetase [bacterium P3]|nr:MAG: tyrosyl-tRNA synthetase [bacterium P3]KWW42712.1 MAG: tyrosyl-tRNA synthetase [bacterium F083]
MSLISELQWRGMIHTVMPGTEQQLENNLTTAYVGIDPTADSLHIGHLVSIMLLKHLQMAGHKPLALVGGATGMIGDPSFKAAERKLLSVEEVRHNVDCIKQQLAKFLDFDNPRNGAEIVNNYDWMKDYLFLDFIRDIGKHITVNYMMAKDSVQKRLETGLSFTEFSYQLLQAYDYLTLYRTKGCRLQMGGSDQWGNITTGTELIRRIEGGEAYALTCPIITKADGTKFGKTEGGNVWLDPSKTSPYKFYQFWLNCSDVDTARYIRIFTLLSQEEIAGLEAQHLASPEQRTLQKALAREITVRVHSEQAYEQALSASQLLFGKGTTAQLNALDRDTLLSVFEGVPQFTVSRGVIDSATSLVDIAVNTGMFSSKGEIRRELKQNAISVNKQKVAEDAVLSAQDILSCGSILIQKGKKNYYLLNIEG